LLLGRRLVVETVDAPPVEVRVAAVGVEWGEFTVVGSVPADALGGPVREADGRVVGMIKTSSPFGQPVAVLDVALLRMLASVVDPAMLIPEHGADRIDIELALQIADTALADGDADRVEAFCAPAAEFAEQFSSDELVDRIASLRRRAAAGISAVPDVLRDVALRFAEITANPDAQRRGAARAEELSRCRDVVRGMRNVDMTAAVGALLGSGSPADQIVGIAVLQTRPDPWWITRLAAFVDPDAHPRHLGYEALVALCRAAENVPDDHLGDLWTAYETVTRLLEGRPSSDRASMLRQLGRIVGTMSELRIESSWLLWDGREMVTVRFFGGSAAQHAVARELAGEWTSGTGIAFRFLAADSVEPADVRIAFVAGGGSRSATGTSARAMAEDQPTMWLDMRLPLTPAGRGQVLRQFGHALGLVPEHEQPHARLQWNHAELWRAFGGAPHHLTPTVIKRRFLARRAFNGVREYRRFDIGSVMCTPFDAALFLDDLAIPVTSELSVSDRQFIAQLYPQAGPTPRLDRVPGRGGLDEFRFWQPGAVLRVRFLDMPELAGTVMDAAAAWTEYADIDFRLVMQGPAEIRITFEGAGNWSAQGTDALVAEFFAPDAPTMCLAEVRTAQSAARVTRVVLHEFGHALGLNHEHQNPTNDIEWDKETVYADLAKPPNSWDRATVDRNLFAVSSRSQPHRAFDPNSIMMFPIPARWTADGRAFPEPCELSAGDINFISAVYPGRR
jgi:hypothetical protein